MLQSLVTSGNKPGLGGKAQKRNRLDGMTPIEPAACDGFSPRKPPVANRRQDMCFCPKSASPNPRRFPSVKQRPPTIAALLDLDQPGERKAQELLTRFSSGRSPTWKPLGVRRSGQSLLVAVEWSPRAVRRPRAYSVVSIAFNETALSWRDFPSAAAARRELCALALPAQSASAGEG